MKNYLLVFSLLSGMTFIPADVASTREQNKESITITTYYPAPFGVYMQMITKTFGVGDNNSDGMLNAGDAPDPYSNAGDAWIAGNLGIGAMNPSQKLEVRGKVKIGAYVLPDTDGKAGQVLTTDGAGSVSWKDVERQVCGGGSDGSGGCISWGKASCGKDKVLICPPDYSRRMIGESGLEGSKRYTYLCVNQ